MFGVGIDREPDHLEHLGYANGWDKTPEIVHECREKGHLGYAGNVGRCLTEYGCEVCGYKYLVDSSD